MIYSFYSKWSKVFWEIVLITLNECPMEVESGFFVGQAELKSEALIGKKKWYGVIETFHSMLLRGRELEAISLLIR